MSVSNLTDEELEAEIARRRDAKWIASVPQPEAAPDWYALRGVAIDRVRRISEGEHVDEDVGASLERVAHGSAGALLPTGDRGGRNLEHEGCCVVLRDDGVSEGSDVLNAGIVDVHAYKIGLTAGYGKNLPRIMNSSDQISMVTGTHVKNTQSTTRANIRPSRGS